MAAPRLKRGFCRVLRLLQSMWARIRRLGGTCSVKSTLRVCRFAYRSVCIGAGGQHRLVAAPGETSVAVYPRTDVEKIANLKKQGGMAGMIADWSELRSKQVDDKAPVQIVSSDDKGDVVEVTHGPARGVSGSCPRAAVN